MKYYYLITFFCFVQFCHAQQDEWIRSIGDTNGLPSPTSLVSKLNGIYTTGPFFGKTDFNPNAGVSLDSSLSYLNGFLNCLDSNGNFVWNISLQSKNEIIPYEVDIDNNQNLIVTGIFQDTLIINSTNKADTLIPLFSSFFILKFNQNGNLLWAKSLRAFRSFVLHEVVIDNSDNIYVSGNLRDSMDIDPGIDVKMIFGLSNPNNDGYILKLNPNGDYLSHKINPILIGRMGIHNENIYFISQTNGLVSIPVDTGIFQSDSSTRFNLVLGKMNANLNINWIKYSYSNHIFYNNFLDDLPINSLGNMIYAASYIDSLSFLNDSSKNLYSQNELRNFILEIDSNGNILNLFDGLSNSSYNRIAIDNQDQIFLTNELRGIKPIETDSGQVNFYFGPQLNSFIIKYSKNFKVKWIKPLSERSLAYPNNIFCDNSNLILTGLYNDSLKINNTVISDDRSMFIAKIKDCQPFLKHRNLTLCEGDSSFIANITAQDTGVIYTTTPSLLGCDTILANHVTIIPASRDTTIYTICKNDSIFVRGNFYFTDTILGTRNQTILGCDSFKIDVIVVKPIDSTFQNIDICWGDSIIIKDSSYFKTGTYYNLYTNQFGCDSTIITHLTTSLENKKITNYTICENDSIQVGNRFYSTSGTYYDTLISFTGCDSILISNLVVIKADTIFEKIDLCNGEVHQVGIHQFYNSGIYTTTLNSTLGCDSVIISDLSFHENKFKSQNFKICHQDSIIIGSSIYKQNGIFIDTLKTIYGCDSIVETEIDKVELNITRSPNNSLFAVQEGAKYQWVKCLSNSAFIVLDSMREFSFSSTGNYALIIEWNDCIDTTNCLTVEYQSNFEAWPNPNHGAFKISIPDEGTLKYFDSKGSLVYKKGYLKAGIYDEYLPALSAGIYILIYNGLHTNYQFKLVLLK